MDYSVFLSSRLRREDRSSIALFTLSQTSAGKLDYAGMGISFGHFLVRLGVAMRNGADVTISV